MNDYWSEREAKYEATALNAPLAHRLARDVSLVGDPSRQVMVNFRERRTVTRNEWRTRTVSREVRGFFGGMKIVQEQERFRAPVEHLEEVVAPTAGWILKSERDVSTTRRSDLKEECTVTRTWYLLSDGSFASQEEECLDFTYGNGRFEVYDKGVTDFSHPLDAENLLYWLDLNEGFIRRLGKSVYAKGDGLRERLINIAAESEKPGLRRRYPSLADRTQTKPAFQGALIRYFPEKGFGFIRHEELGEVFLHVSRVPDGERLQLAAGALVGFDVRNGPKGPSATNARVIG